MMAMIEEKRPEAPETYFNMMYTLYAFPNIILPMIAGALIDRFGRILQNYYSKNRL